MRNAWRVRGLGANPSSGATRHLLPQGEKEDNYLSPRLIQRIA